MTEEKTVDLKAYETIDSMCRWFYCDPESVKALFQHWEMRVQSKTTFAGVFKRMQLKPGEEWKILTQLGKPAVEDVVKEMDEIGIELAFMDQLMQWSYREHQVMSHYSIEKLAALIERSGKRIVGGAGYNPFRIKESLEDIERAVKEYGFKYVWFHPITFGLAYNDKKCYPLYQKCYELNIPCCFQAGHSAEPLPSWVGHPMTADEVAIDFPDLTLVLTHTGWPWIDEWMSVIWRQPNVYGNIGSYYPSGLDPSIVSFMDGRGREKVMWASNGLGMTRCKKEFLELPIREESKKLILSENAKKVYHL